MPGLAAHWRNYSAKADAQLCSAALVMSRASMPAEQAWNGCAQRLERQLENATGGGAPPCSPEAVVGLWIERSERQRDEGPGGAARRRR